MTNDLITPDEIKTLRSSAKVITLEMVDLFLQDSPVQILPEPIHLKSGYMVQMSKDTVANMVVEHISIYRQDGKTDPADAEHIANAILGEGRSSMPSMLDTNALHFLKLIK
ncbi:MAG: hypothetical protein WCE94_08610 [Candidatus Methanoperedens sp.]